MSNKLASQRLGLEAPLKELETLVARVGALSIRSTRTAAVDLVNMANPAALNLSAVNDNKFTQTAEADGEVGRAAAALLRLRRGSAASTIPRLGAGVTKRRNEGGNGAKTRVFVARQGGVKTRASTKLARQV